MPTPPVRDASTVILLRDRDVLEVFLVRRNAKSSFMANRFVYPGGRVDDGDGGPHWRDRLLGAPPTAGERLALGEDRSIAFILAGIRETFEEAGVLLARNADGSAWQDHWTPEARWKIRDELQEGRRDLREIANELDLYFSMDDMIPFAHWITPSFEPKRFDTFFFAALMQGEVEPCHDERETTDSFWRTPAQALEDYRRGEFLLAPPTLRTLEQLSEYQDFDQIRQAQKRRERLPTIIPQLGTSQRGNPVLILPGDPEYPSDDAAFSEATPVDDEVTRIELEDEIWHSRR
jgi:8-oxo-dGTP pyrophosphatase MutT (NUDIX family)